MWVSWIKTKSCFLEVVGENRFPAHSDSQECSVPCGCRTEVPFLAGSKLIAISEATAFLGSWAPYSIFKAGDVKFSCHISLTHCSASLFCFEELMWRAQLNNVGSSPYFKDTWLEPNSICNFNSCLWCDVKHPQMLGIWVWMSLAGHTEYEASKKAKVVRYWRKGMLFFSSFREFANKMWEEEKPSRKRGLELAAVLLGSGGRGGSLGPPGQLRD